MQKTERTDQVLYGPPPRDCVLGDMNMDNCLDARDLAKLKQIIIEHDGPIHLSKLGDPDGDGWITVSVWDEIGIYHPGDLNQDLEVNKDDVKALIQKLTGKPVKPDEQQDDDKEKIVTTVTTEETGKLSTIPTTYRDWDIVVPLYGPPPAA